MNHDSNENSVTRRKALQVLGFGVVAPSVLAACQQESAKAPAEKEAKKKKPAEKETTATAGKEKTGAEAGEGEEKMAAKAEGGGELNCNDPSDYDAQSAQMRKTLQYVEKSPKEGKKCSNCMQWKPPEKEGECGGCKLFAGPVNPNGYCLSYAPQKG